MERDDKEAVPAGIFHGRTRGPSKRLQSNGKRCKRNQTLAEALLTISTVKLMLRHYERNSKHF